MSKKKPDKSAELAAEMLGAFETEEFKDKAHPPTLQELGDRCDGAPSPDLILKAANKPIFKAKLFVEKVNGKPSLNSKVYAQEEKPKPESLLADQMLRVLDSQRRLGEGSYPPTLRRLAELSGFKGADKALRTAVATAPMVDRAIVLVKKGKSIVIDAPVVLKEDIAGGLDAVLPGLLRFALSPVITRSKKGPTETAAFAPKEIGKRFLPEVGDRLEAAVRSGAASLALPKGIGWVLVKGEPLLFLTENLKGASAPPTSEGDGHIAISRRHEAPAPSSPDDEFRPRDFAGAFRAAFEILDRRNGLTNFVKLADLRPMLGEFSREEFDAGLRQLRIDGVFSLDSHEGLYGSLSHEEREAGVREAGSLLVYASRR